MYKRLELYLLAKFSTTPLTAFNLSLVWSSPGAASQQAAASAFFCGTDLDDQVLPAGDLGWATLLCLCAARVPSATLAGAAHACLSCICLLTELVYLVVSLHLDAGCKVWGCWPP